MNVLIAMECSGIIREAFRRKGHEAWSCDLKPAEDESPFHIQCDVWKVLNSFKPDLAIFHPPCTWLSVSGIHWNDRGRRGLAPAECWQQTHEAAIDFMRCIHADVPMIAVENPIGIMSTRYRQPDQVIQPWEFGDDASKATCLWLKGLPILKSPMNRYASPRILHNGKRWVGRWSNQTDSGQNRLSPGEQRSTDRARSYPGIADAMAEQWNPDIWAIQERLYG